MGRDVDRIYLDGVIRRSKVMLQQMIDAMNMTRTTEVQYFIQKSMPVVVRELDRARALRQGI